MRGRCPRGAGFRGVSSRPFSARADQAGTPESRPVGLSPRNHALAGLPAAVADVIPYRTQEAFVQSFVSLYPADFCLFSISDGRGAVLGR